MKYLSRLTKNFPALLASFLFLTAIPAHAASSTNTSPASETNEVTLKMGSRAPKLQVGEWIQGEPVKEFEPGKVYIVEFWATWCGPCKENIPHLTAIQKKYQDRGLIVIGQDVLERNEALVVPFVKKMGDKMTYRVAMDDKSGNQPGKMHETWMTAAGKNAIPVAFLVNQRGTVAWIGNPLFLEESTIEAVLEDKFDIAKAVVVEEERSKTREHINELLELADKALKSNDLAKAEISIANCEKELPANMAYESAALRTQLQFLKGDQDGALKITIQAVDKFKEKIAVQNFFAQLLTRVANPKPALLDEAELIATRINESSEGKDINGVYTLGRVAFLKGQKDKAIEYQTKVIELSSAASKAKMQEYLDLYKAGKLPGKTIQPVSSTAQSATVKQ